MTAPLLGDFGDMAEPGQIDGLRVRGVSLCGLFRLLQRGPSLRIVRTQGNRGAKVL